jgi:hypothetical protein
LALKRIVLTEQMIIVARQRLFRRPCSVLNQTKAAMLARRHSTKMPAAEIQIRFHLLGRSQLSVTSQ